MICPHCSTSVKFEWQKVGPVKQVSNAEGKVGYFIFHDSCPHCDEYVIYYSKCTFGISDVGHAYSGEVLEQKLVYPSVSEFQYTEYVPKKFLEDYSEARKVLSASPKASAALSRRLLQLILREKFEVKKRSLSQEIQEFIGLTGIPTHLTDAVDAIRNVGNLAAHPMKDKHTGEIVSVEPGEAEWLIEVIEALFDFSFVQPEKLKQRRNNLNEKLSKLGKPKMKKGTHE